MDPILGQLMLFAGNFAPRGWAKCEGQLLPISQYSALFSILGTTYGGDGRTTFALPDLRGRVPMGEGHGPGLSMRKLGAKTGAETHTLTVNEMPSHHHSIYGAKGDPTPVGTRHIDNDLTADMQEVPDQMSNVGGNQAHNIMQPSLVMTWCIATVGIFPSRS